MLSLNRKLSSVTSNQTELSLPAFAYPYRSGVKGGMLAGLAMIVFALISAIANHTSIWLPINLIGSTLIPDLRGASIDVLSQFNAAGLIAGLALHMLISIGLGFIFALILPTLPGSPIVWAIAISTWLWLTVSQILQLINPAMTAQIDLVSFFFAHVAYGLVLGSWIAHTPKVHVN
jgi:hypothetical protein